MSRCRVHCWMLSRPSPMRWCRTLRRQRRRSACRAPAKRAPCDQTHASCCPGSSRRGSCQGQQLNSLSPEILRRQGGAEACRCALTFTVPSLEKQAEAQHQTTALPHSATAIILVDMTLDVQGVLLSQLEPELDVSASELSLAGSVMDSAVQEMMASQQRAGRVERVSTGLQAHVSAEPSAVSSGLRRSRLGPAQAAQDQQQLSRAPAGSQAVAPQVLPLAGFAG